MAIDARDAPRDPRPPPVPQALHGDDNGNSNGHGNGAVARHNGDVADADAPKCHFEVAPPRHFLYPAILLLIGEEARHGYRLVDALLRFGFGPVDRPSIYRVLSDLAHDDLVVSWEAESIAGSSRHMYALTEAGRAQLVEWMTIISIERDGLDRVLGRFEAWKEDHPAR